MLVRNRVRQPDSAAVRFVGAVTPCTCDAVPHRNTVRFDDRFKSEATSMKSFVKGLMRSTSSCVFLVAMCVAVAAQHGSVAVDQSARVLSLENAWNQAEFTHDARALSTLVAEAFDFTDDDGRFMNKSQWLANIRNRVDHYEQLSSSSMAVHMYGNVAVATGMYQDKITEKGKGVMHSGRFTDIWIQQNGEWKCVASQSTLISH